MRESASFGKKDVAQVIHSKQIAIYNDILLILWYEAQSYYLYPAPHKQNDYVTYQYGRDYNLAFQQVEKF